MAARLKGYADTEYRDCHSKWIVEDLTKICNVSLKLKEFGFPILDWDRFHLVACRNQNTTQRNVRLQAIPVGGVC